MDRIGQNGLGRQNEGNERENKEPKVKFGFSKIITNKVIQGNRVVTDGSFSSRGKASRYDDDEKDFVTRVIGTTIEGSRKEEKKKELVIPLIQPKESGALVPAPLSIGFDPKFSSNAERSSQEDYDRVPVSQFGLAMLRGMGWKEEEGIGLKNKKVVELREPVVRPRGLGLGAERPQASKDVLPPSNSKEGSKVLAIKVGAFAVITKGHRKGMYGQIESLDEDNNRVIMKLVLGSDKMATISKFYIDLVDAEEFKKKSKVLNNEKYEAIKSEIDKKNQKREELEDEIDRKHRKKIDLEDETDKKHRKREELDYEVIRKHRKSESIKREREPQEKRRRSRERRDSGDEKRRRRNR